MNNKWKHFCFASDIDFKKMFLKVYFPTSTYIHLHLWTYQTENVIEVNIFPSIFDEEQSGGLCNKLGSNWNDLFDSRGKISVTLQHFVDSWRLEKPIIQLLQMHFYCS